jgi:segregation and condensation protein B
MSLKAKLEAVIYAAEEPVTLNQLAGLFAADALEWKAAQEAAAAEQTAEVARGAPASDPLPFLAEGLEYLGLADTPEVYAGNQAEIGGAISPEAAAGSIAPEAPPQDNTPPPPGEIVSVAQDAAYPSILLNEDSPPELLEAAPTLAEAEAESKRLARQRDREVKSVLKQLLDELIVSYSADGRGIEIREIAGGYRMATKPQCHDAVRLFVKSLKPPLKLSLPALETLAVIAYKQPVTAPEVNEIRGVESAGVLGSLLARKLIATAGRKQVIGRPILYKTTREFLLRFGLNDVSELPSMEEFEKMAATELEMEPEAAEADKAEQDEAVVSEGTGPDTIAQDSAALPPESESLDQAPAEAMTAITADPESTRNLSEPASSDSHQTAETEASHAEEIQKESGVERDRESGAESDRDHRAHGSGKSGAETGRET